MKKFNPKRYDFKPLEGGILCDKCPLSGLDSPQCKTRLREIAELRGVKDREDGPTGLICDHFKIIKVLPKWRVNVLRLGVAACCWLALSLNASHEITDWGRILIAIGLLGGLASGLALMLEGIKRKG